MNEPGSPPKVCGRCSARLPANAPEGLCPRCLGALNLAGETVFTETETPRVPPPSPEQIAAHFPQLEILECLGRGGMGVVYKARQKSLARLVALKLLAPEREKDPQFGERFAREAQALAQLNHPHIVTVYDFGQTNGFFYLLMEFVDGVNLRQLLQARKLTPEEALAIVPPLCEALQFAHERGIVHRDIKPENLLLAKDGRVKVADFGIAKMLGDEAQIAEERAAGTPGYMAPEQMEMPPRVDSRADIYSLGVVFYEMLTGELPANKFAPPSRKVAIDVRIDEVVVRALERSPELRWQTAAEMRTRLETIASASTEESASPKERDGHAANYWQDRKFWLLLACVGLIPAVLLIGLILVLFIMFVDANGGRVPNFLSRGAVWKVVGLAVLVALVVWFSRQRKTHASPANTWPRRVFWLFVSLLLFFGMAAQALYLLRSQPQPPGARRWESNGDITARRPTSPQPGAPQPAPESPQSVATEPAAVATTPQFSPATPSPSVAEPQSRVPMLSDIPLLGRLFTKTAPDLTSREAARRELLRMEQELLTLGDHLRRGLVGEADYKKAETAVRVMRRSAEATDEELKRTPLTQIELGRRIDAELLQRGLIGPSAPASEAARIRLRAAEAELKRASAQRDQGLISTAEYESAETQFKLADAELRGDRAAAAQVRLHAAEKTLARATAQREQGIISNADYEKAAMALELAHAEGRAIPAQTQAAAPSAADTAGIGVGLREEEGHIVIDSILPGAPAAHDGTLKPGHEIRSIGDSGDQLVSIAGWKLEDVVARLRGKNGTQVSLFVVRSGVGTIVTLIRRKLPELEPGREHPKAELRLKTPRTQTGWQLRRFLGEGAEMEKEPMTAPPLWVPGDPPMIVTSRGHRLTAFAAGKDGGEIAWQSQLDAAISSAPTWDAKLRRIYFGTIDNHVHAVDAHGRRRWSFAAGGKVVTHPMAANEVVVFGCDDHQVYGVNTETGAVKWTFGATASATSAPAMTEGLVVIGSTDGSAHALEPQTGEKKWSYEATNPGTNSIYAPILGAGDWVYLATSGGEVVALDSKTGDTRWMAKLGGATDTAMAVGSDQLFVVEGGSVRGLDLASGRLMWQSAADEYVGAPLVFDNSLIVARRHGAVRRLDFAGLVLEEWKAPGKQGQEATVRFPFGPVAGGGALWLTDDKGTIWRLGPPMPQPNASSDTPAGSLNPPIGFSR